MPTVTDLLSNLDNIANTTIAANASRYDREAAWPEASIQALAQAGFLGLSLGPDAGGLSQGPAVYARVLERIAQACPSTAMIYMMHVCAAEVIKQSSLPAKTDILQAMARGRHLSTLAFSEKGSRSHFWAPTSQVRQTNGTVHLSSQKSFVTSAGHADSYIVSTRSAQANAATDSTLYYVEGSSPGVSTAGAWDGLGLRANASAPMNFDSGVSSQQQVSADGGGFNVMLSVVLPWFQLGSAAVANGIATAALGLAKQHLNGTRLEHLGETLASLPTLRAKLAAAQVSLDASRALTSQTAVSMEKPDDGTMLLVLESKVFAGEMVLGVTDAAMRMCGGAAFSKLLPVERYFRDARAASVMAPTTDVLYEFIGKAVLGLPLF